MIKLLVTVCLGGAIGSLLRYGVAVWFLRHVHYNFPFATFAVNVTGCFLIGLFYALSERFSWFSPDWRLFFITGFCGGLTTFSAFAYENMKLLQSGNYLLFLMYAAGSFLLSVAAVLVGINSLKFL
ncbi:MAG: fluoride efflux transporter CrcB [Segetibacter sp.]